MVSGVSSEGRREAVFVSGGAGADLVGVAEADEYMEESRFNAEGAEEETQTAQRRAGRQTLRHSSG